MKDMKKNWLVATMVMVLALIGGNASAADPDCVLLCPTDAVPGTEMSVSLYEDGEPIDFTTQGATHIFIRGESGDPPFEYYDFRTWPITQAEIDDGREPFIFELDVDEEDRTILHFTLEENMLTFDSSFWVGTTEDDEPGGSNWGFVELEFVPFVDIIAAGGDCPEDEIAVCGPAAPAGPNLTLNV